MSASRVSCTGCSVVVVGLARKVVGDSLSDDDPSRKEIVEALGLAAGADGARGVLFVGRNRFDVMVEVSGVTADELETMIWRGMVWYGMCFITHATAVTVP